MWKVLPTFSWNFPLAKITTFTDKSFTDPFISSLPFPVSSPKFKLQKKTSMKGNYFTAVWHDCNAIPNSLNIEKLCDSLQMLCPKEEIYLSIIKRFKLQTTYGMLTSFYCIYRLITAKWTKSFYFILIACLCHIEHSFLKISHTCISFDSERKICGKVM